jgi:formate hydrogenlyase subunit 4
LGNVFFPWGIALTLQPLALVGGFIALTVKLGVLALSLALLETGMAKLRLFLVPALLSASFMLALLAVISFFFLR